MVTHTVKLSQFTISPVKFLQLNLSNVRCWPSIQLEFSSIISQKTLKKHLAR